MMCKDNTFYNYTVAESTLPLSLKRDHLNIPIEIIEYVFNRKLRKHFRLFLYLKSISSGKIRSNSIAFRQARKILGIQDKRTIDKNILDLLNEYWIGFNPKSGIYFIRSFDYLMWQHSFRNKRVAQFNFKKDINDLDAFMFGAIVGERIIRHMNFREFHKREERRIVTDKRGVARQILRSPLFPDYIGLSVKAMGNLFGMSQTRAYELKSKAEQAGYLICNNKFRNVVRLESPDKTIKSFIGRGDPELSKKIRFSKRMVDGKKGIYVKEQLYDEVIPLISFKYRRLRKHPPRRKYFPSTSGGRTLPWSEEIIQTDKKNDVLPPFCE